MNDKVSGFTLIEMIIVLSIIGILTLGTMMIMGGRLSQLQAKVTKESVLANLQNIYTHVLNSSYIDGQRYDEVTVSFSQGSGDIKYEYTTIGQNEPLQYGLFQENRLKLEAILQLVSSSTEKKLTTLDVTYVPYSFACSGSIVSDVKEPVVLFYSVNEIETFCLQYDSSNCRFREMMCPKVPTINTFMQNLD